MSVLAEAVTFDGSFCKSEFSGSFADNGDCGSAKKCGNQEANRNVRPGRAGEADGQSCD